LDCFAETGRAVIVIACAQCDAVFAAGAGTGRPSQWRLVNKPVQSVGISLTSFRCGRDPTGPLALQAKARTRQRVATTRLQKNSIRSNRSYLLRRWRQIVIDTTDIHLAHRIGGDVQRAFYGECEMNLGGNGDFARATWTPAVSV
jgi:hypothetical protein